MVRSGAGTWTRLGTVYLPGPVVPADGHRDASHRLDTTWHEPDRELLGHLGLAAVPAVRSDQRAEEWLADYTRWAERHYHDELPPRSPRPAE